MKVTVTFRSDIEIGENEVRQMMEDDVNTSNYIDVYCWLEDNLEYDAEEIELEFDNLDFNIYELEEVVAEIEEDEESEE